MITEKTIRQVKEIKQSFRLLMNGEASRQMRESGLGYHLNWGVSLNDLKAMANQYPKDEQLAIELWKENIRECKILATMLMPVEKMTPELTELWMEQAGTQEIVELLAFNLLKNLDFATVLAFEWIASTDDLHQIGGYHVISRRLTDGMVPDDRGICEIIDQAVSAMSDKNLAVRHAAYNCLNRLALLGEDYASIVDSALEKCGLSQKQ